MTVTVHPASVNFWAADRPARPPPRTITLRDVDIGASRGLGGRGVE
jgi:hypothetical protein